MKIAKPPRSGPARGSILRNRRGQLADLGVDTTAIIFLLLINIIMYGVFALSAVGIVKARHQSTITLLGAPEDPYIASTLSTYLRTPMPDRFETRHPGEAYEEDLAGEPKPMTKVSAETNQFLKENPEIWKSRTYGEFLSLLATTQSTDKATLSRVFSEVSEATFANAAPPQKILDFRYDLLDPADKVASAGIGIASSRPPEPERTATAPIPTLRSGTAQIALHVPKPAEANK